jgi:hypothetical protein
MTEVRGQLEAVSTVGPQPHVGVTVGDRHEDWGVSLSARLLDS